MKHFFTLTNLFVMNIFLCLWMHWSFTEYYAFFQNIFFSSWYAYFVLWKSLRTLCTWCKCALNITLFLYWTCVVIYLKIDLVLTIDWNMQVRQRILVHLTAFFICSRFNRFPYSLLAIFIFFQLFILKKHCSVV